MKIIVIFKWSRNPQDARVSADGKVEWRGVKLSPSDDDHAVLEVARNIAGDGEIVALTIGDGDLSWAAARGAASTLVVTDALTELNSAATGAVLAAAVKRIGDADAVIIGDSDWDYAVVAALMGKLGWTSVAKVVEASAEQGALKVTRKLGNISQVLEVQGPVVLGVAASRAEQDAPGMKEVLGARKKPVEKITVADLGLEAQEAIASQGTRFPDTPPAKVIDGADPAAACEQLVAALRSDGVL